MKNKSVLAIFVVALAAVVSGVFYFGGALNQQASLGNITGKLTGNTPSIDEPTIPTSTATELQWRNLCRDKAPHIELLSPNGGETYFTEQNMLIKWRSCNIPNNGMTRLLLARNLPNNSQDGVVILDTASAHNLSRGSYTWKIPTTINEASNYFISVVCGDGNGNCSTGSGSVITDDSDNVFAINQYTKVSVKTSVTNPPTSTITASQSHITSNVRLLGFTISASNGDVYLSKIPVQVKSTGSSIQDTVKIFKLTDENGNIIQQIGGTSGNRISSGVISTVAGCTGKECGYLFSNFGTIKIPKGTTKEFSIFADIAPITASTGDLTRTLKASIVNNDVIVPTNFGVSNQNGDIIHTSEYTGSALGNIITLTLNTVASPTTNTGSTSTTTSWTNLCADGQPHVQVLSPNGSENYTAGSTMIVKWKTCNIPNNSSVGVSIHSSMFIGGGVTNIIDTNNDGFERIIIPTFGYGNVPLASGDYYKVNVSSGPGTVSDFSDNTFTITNNSL